MDSNPGPSQGVKLIERLRAVVTEFSTREEGLLAEFRTRTATLRHQRDTAVGEVERQLETRRQLAAGAFDSATAAARTRGEARRGRIREAHKASLRQAVQRAEEAEGGRKYKLQMDTMQARRTRESDLAASDAALEAFTLRLQEAETQLLDLEAMAVDAFRGFGGFHRGLRDLVEAELPSLDGSPETLEEALRRELAAGQGRLREFRRRILPRVFNYLPLWGVLLASLFGLVPLLPQFGIQGFSYGVAGGVVGGCLLLGIVLHKVASGQGGSDARAAATALGRARRLLEACREKSIAGHAADRERIEAEFVARGEWIEAEWQRAQEEAVTLREHGTRSAEERAPRAARCNERLLALTLERIESRHQAELQAAEAEAGAQRRELAEACASKEARVAAELESRWSAAAAEWNGLIRPLYAEIERLRTADAARSPAWEPSLWSGWKPPGEFAQCVRFAELAVDLRKLAGSVPGDPRLPLPGPAAFTLPLQLSFPSEGSLLVETPLGGRDVVMGAFNSVILRLLSCAPAGRLNFTLIDPVGLGQNFSGVMHLADHEEHLIGGRIWTQGEQIERRLADLNEHMEKVIQMYLRNEYATIADYNAQAGTIAEKYHFVVIADFPSGFTDTAARRLLSIATSGARCGVFTLIHWDPRQPLPQDFPPAELRRAGFCVGSNGAEFFLAGGVVPGLSLRLDAPPPADLAIDFVHRVGRASKDSNRVEVPFSQIAPPDASIWEGETSGEVRVAIGRTGATKLQYLAMGKGTRQHALVAGKTGSGKSTLFHVIITNLALWCSPEQVEFYLIDFKKGVEFKCYATQRLPHARVVAIESDREFGLSVLQRVDDELKRRGDLFRKLGVQDIPGYLRAGGTDPMPRSLLLIDEFQELFVEDDRVAQSASLLLDRIIRQGRAFGIHVILGSQTLGGAYTVARATLGQMVIRIALMCNEADAYLIMDDNNSAPSLLSRPGEGIYNDTAGTTEGNSPFQAVWLSDEIRDTYLARIQAEAQRRGRSYPGPFVFEGDVPADVVENALLASILSSPPVRPPRGARIWLGSPNSIKGPTEAVLQRQSGNNLLLVGQREEATLAFFAVAMIALAAQHPRGTARFLLLDGTPPESPEREYLDAIVRLLPHEVVLSRGGDLGGALSAVAQSLENASAGGGESPAGGVTTYVLVNGIQRYKKLRNEDEFSFSTDDASGPNPAALFNRLITEGPSAGIHLIVACDSFNNVNRFLSRKAVSEFEMRVLFQMSANDSSSLIDSPKASTLGLHRALYYNEQQGYLETFRPYALPSRAWLEGVAERLSAAPVPGV